MPEFSSLAKLNPSQEKAVLTTDGPVLVVAGAGSGKTKVLAHRIAHLIEKGVPPESILAITFTNKAAEEMKNRIYGLLPKRDYRQGLPWVGTFHSLGVFILRESGGKIGVLKNFSILDDEDSLSFIKESIKDLELDPKQFQPARLRALISRKKNEMISVENFKNEAEGYFPKIMASVWEKYEKKLADSRSLDFDDLLIKTVELFTKYPDVLEIYQKCWRYVHVDEYQDTNQVQYHLTRLLAQSHKNICVVGDVDQAIYSWRGADFRNILQFQNDWPGAFVITLEENYRSTQLILDAANAVIVKNKLRLSKNLFSKKTEGPKISIFEASNEEEEASFLAEAIKNLTETKGKEKTLPEEIAILYRTNFQSRVIEEKMIEAGIPYQLIGVKFFERKEIKDVLAYLKAALNPDDILSAKRIINLPPRAIGKTLTAKFLAKDKLNQKEENKISDFKGLLKKLEEGLREKTASEAVKFVLDKTGLKDYLDDGTEEGAMRSANVAELVSLAKRYDPKKPPEGILCMLEEAALMSEQDTIKTEKAVKLMTVHAAKGLEFRAVFVAGLEEGLFPHRSMSDNEEESRKEEERRLFYVALTRAKERLYLSYAVFRTIFGSRQINLPSSFIPDIPEELLERAEATQIINIAHE